MCRIANPTQRPALRTSPRTEAAILGSLSIEEKDAHPEKVRMCIFIIMAIAWPRYLACVLWELPDVVGVASK